MKYTAEFFKNTKIRLESEEHNKYVQGLAIECGYEWYCPTTGNRHKNVTGTDRPFLLFHKNKVIGQCYIEYIFNTYDDFKEIFIPMPEEIKWPNNKEYTVYADGGYWRYVAELIGRDWLSQGCESATLKELRKFDDYEERPHQTEEIKWPDDERFTIRANQRFWFLDSTFPYAFIYVSQNGRYSTDKSILKNYVDFAERPHQTEDRKVSVCTRDDLRPTYKKATEYLTECAKVQEERGKQYDSEGAGERSFVAAAQAFNALTGKDLSGSDICLIQACLKVVRQNSDPERVHEDSLLDGVSYMSLWAEEINKELQR